MLRQKVEDKFKRPEVNIINPPGHPILGGLGDFESSAQQNFKQKLHQRMVWFSAVLKNLNFMLNLLWLLLGQVFGNNWAYFSLQHLVTLLLISLLEMRS